MRVVGLQNTKFQDTDPSRFSQAVRSAMEPMPRIEIGTCRIDDRMVGAIYVHQENDGPIIASKSDQEYREGTVYFRYPGESRAIGAAEFRRLLAERDNKVRGQSSASIARLMELGPRATVLDIGSSGPEATKIVREGIDEADVLRNFVRQEKVEFPLAYLLRSCSTARGWLPIFYYIKLAKIPISDAIKLIAEKETSYVARKRDLLARLKGEKIAYTKSVGRIATLLRRLMKGDFNPPEDSRSAADIALAISGLPDARLEVTKLLQLFRVCIEKIREDKTSRVDVWSYVYKAAARLDELYFKS